MNIETKLLTVAQTAERLGVNRQRVLQLIKTDRLPARKLGTYYTVLETDVEVFGRQTRRAGRPPKQSVAPATASRPPQVSFAQAAAAFLGKHKDLPPDLSTNKDYLEGFGRD